MADINSIVNKGKVSLEKKAADRFGAAVEDFRRGDLQSLSPGEEFVDPSGNPIPENARGDSSFRASSYAAALAGGTSYRPKMKFLFKVEFIFTPEAQEAFRDVLGSTDSQDFTFLVKSVDRPKIDFEYEDDVNMYNFRTKVLKKIRHRELTITFMDDVGNRVLKFFRALMMIHSPITRRQMLREGQDYPDRLRPPDSRSISAGHGMMFTDFAEPTLEDTAIRGVVNSDVGNAIQTIRIKQMYVNPGSSLGSSLQEVIFDFLNARLVSFDLDDLNHETSDVNIMTMQFDYDWMEIVESGPLAEADTPLYAITVPGITDAPVDVSSSVGAAGGASSLDAGGRGNRLNRTADGSITPETISRSMLMTPGGGMFTPPITAPISGIPDGTVGSASQHLSSGMAGAVSKQAAGGAQFLSGLGGGLNGAGGISGGLNSGGSLSTGGNNFGAVKNLILPPAKSTQAVSSVKDSTMGGYPQAVSVIKSKIGGF